MFDDKRLTFGSKGSTLSKQLPRIVETHLTNSMFKEEVNMVMRNRFQKLSLPSLHSEPTAHSDSCQQNEMGPHSKQDTEAEEFNVSFVPSEHSSDGNYESSITGISGSVMWSTRTKMPTWPNVILTGNCGILYTDEGIPIEDSLDTTPWRVNNSVLVQVCNRLPKLKQIIMEFPECTSVSVIRKLKFLEKIILKNGRDLEDGSN